jgi:hypothetical protein
MSDDLLNLILASGSPIAICDIFENNEIGYAAKNTNCLLKIPYIHGGSDQFLQQTETSCCAKTTLGAE